MPLAVQFCGIIHYTGAETLNGSVCGALNDSKVCNLPLDSNLQKSHIFVQAADSERRRENNEISRSFKHFESADL